MQRRTLLVVAVVAVVVLAAVAVATTYVLGLGQQVSATGQQAASVGLAAGGAQDATAFRRNVREGYVPQPTDLTYAGLYHDYYFDTGQQRPCEARFCPSYSRAVAEDPLSNETEYYATVGLNSGVSTADFQRQNLTVVVVVDTSDSMSSSFSKYYYDDGEKRRVEENTAKMAAARQAVRSMVGHLGPGDRVGVVTFDDDAEVVQPVVEATPQNRRRVRDAVGELRADGGTNLAAGMEAARALARPDASTDDDRQTRVVVVTDAMPNLGETDEGGLGATVQQDAERGLYTTFVGVGVDFNSRLTEAISTTRGANYYAVQSPSAFRERMDEGFDYMVQPMVYNLTLRVDSAGFDVDHVYGSPQADRSTGEVMRVATLFPSRTRGNRTEGGVVLVELDRTGDARTLNLTARYELENGTARSTTRTVHFPEKEPPYYESSGVRKAVALANYGTLVRNWAAYERALAGSEANRGETAVTPDEGVEYRQLGEWEQQSVELTVSSPYDQRIREFARYFRAQSRALNGSLDRDRRILQRLVDETTAEGGVENPTPTPTPEVTANATASETLARTANSTPESPLNSTASETP